MANKITNRIGKIALWSFATCGLASLLSKVDITPDYLKERVGQTSSGFSYVSRLTRLNHPYDITANQYVIEFGDGVKVEDAFADGYLGPFEIINHQGNRIISSNQFKGNENNYAAVIVDDNKRRDLLQRVQEVYQQQGFDVVVREN